MKKALLVLVVVVLALGVWQYLKTQEESSRTPDGSPDERPQSGEEFQKGDQDWIRYTDSDTMLQLEYRESPDGYVLLTTEGSELDEEGPDKVYTLFDREEYEELIASEEPREGPPSITIDVYQLEPNITPNEWVVSTPRSNYGAESELTTGVLIDNQPAVRYEWDGLYRGESVVVARKGWIYVFSVTWLDSESGMRADFETLLESVKIL